MTRSNGYAGAMIYARMSSADIRRARAQARGNPEKLDELIAEKIASHLADCRKYAADEGWAVLAEYHDNMISGSARYRKASDVLAERDAMLTDLRERAGQRVIVLSTEVERLYRDTDESRELVRLARLTPVTVISTDGEEYDLSTANGEAAFEAAVTKGQRESAKVSERRRRKEARRAEAGGYWGNEPFGYHKVYDTDPGTGQRYYTGQLRLCTGSCCPDAGRPGCTHHGNGCWLTPGREFAPLPGFWADLAADDGPEPARLSGPLGEAELTWLAAQSLTGGASLHSIVRDWESTGVTTRNGQRWSQQMIRAMLLNKRLNGIRVHRAGDKWGRADRKSRGDETPGQWPAILDDELSAAVRGVLMSPERYKHLTPASARGVREHLLAGLAECGRVWGPEGGVRQGRVCGAKMKGHPAPRSRNKQAADGTRPRQYACPKVHGGCGRCRRSTETADAWVIEHIRRWTRPGGEYDQFLARERARHDAARTAVAAELAAIEDQQQASRTVLAGFTELMTSGQLAPGTARWDVTMAAVDRIEAEQAGRAARAAKLLSAAAPPSPEDLRADLAVLWDPAAPVAVRADRVRRLVAKVIIRPPGQGTRLVFDPGTVEVIPGPWADGFTAAELAVAPPAGKHGKHARDVILEYLAAHPGSTPREAAGAAGISHSFACTVLAKLRAAGEVTADRERGTGRRPARYTLAG